LCLATIQSGGKGVIKVLKRSPGPIIQAAVQSAKTISAGILTIDHGICIHPLSWEGTWNIPKSK
jgi:hypothetical protein